MTEQTTNPYADPNYRHTVDTGQPYTPPPAPKKQAWWKKPVVILPIATLVLGLGLGMSNRPDPVTNTVTVEKPVEKIVEKEVTPKACILALDLADEGFGYSAEAMGYMSAALTAAGNIDAAGLTKASSDLGVVTPKMKELAPRMKSAQSQCRAAG